MTACRNYLIERTVDRLLEKEHTRASCRKVIEVMLKELTMVRKPSVEGVKDALMREHGTHDELCRRTHFTYDVVKAALRVLHLGREIHVTGYKPSGHAPIKIYAYGNKPDAELPVRETRTPKGQMRKSRAVIEKPDAPKGTGSALMDFVRQVETKSVEATTECESSPVATGSALRDFVLRHG